MTNYRWTICAMLFFATTVNYLDRQVLSLTWDEFIKPEFHWDESHYGTITSVFSIVYAICMLFAGRFVDWMGTKKATFGPLVSGLPVLASMLSAVSSQKLTLVSTAQQNWLAQQETLSSLSLLSVCIASSLPAVFWP